jgi:hypothetical protein
MFFQSRRPYCQFQFTAKQEGLEWRGGLGLQSLAARKNRPVVKRITDIEHKDRSVIPRATMFELIQGFEHGRLPGYAMRHLFVH